MKTFRTLIVFMLMMYVNLVSAQDLPFADISKTPDKYSSGNLMARTVAGLGFRYYWATEGLRQEDLDFRPVVEGRSSMETLEHIFDLSNFLLSVFGSESEVSDEVDKKRFDSLRKATLINFEKAHDILANSKDEDFESYNVSGKLPFWNAINGPIADALWHAGQVVLMRRMSGNPIPNGVNVLMGVKN